MTLCGTQLHAQPHHPEGEVTRGSSGAFQERSKGKGLIPSPSSVGWCDGRADGRSTALDRKFPPRVGCHLLPGSPWRELSRLWEPKCLALQASETQPVLGPEQPSILGRR